MQLIDISLEQVFNVRHVPRRPRQDPYTTFSFIADGQTCHGVTVPGAPHIEAGHTITALCRKPGHLASIVGWQNQTTGEVVLPSAQSALAMMVLLGAVGVMTWATLPSEPMVGLRWLKALGGGVALLWALGLFRQWRRIRKEITTLRDVPNARLQSDVGIREPL